MFVRRSCVRVRVAAERHVTGTGAKLKNFWGQYTSGQLKAWDEIVSMYRKDMVCVRVRVCVCALACACVRQVARLPAHYLYFSFFPFLKSSSGVRVRVRG